MKKFGEMAGRVKRLRGEVDALETELKRPRTELVDAEVGVDPVAENMDSELGYGRH